MLRIPGIPVTCAEVITRNTKPRQSLLPPQPPTTNNWPKSISESISKSCFETHLWQILFVWGRWIIVSTVPLLPWCLTNTQNMTTLRANNLKTISISLSLGEFSKTDPFPRNIMVTLMVSDLSMSLISCPFPSPSPTNQLVTGGQSPGKETLSTFNSSLSIR